MIKEGDLILPESFKQEPAPHAQANVAFQKKDNKREAECNVIVVISDESDQEEFQVQRVSKTNNNHKEVKERKEIKENKQERKETEKRKEKEGDVEKEKREEKEKEGVKGKEEGEEENDSTTYYYDDDSEDENEAPYMGLFSKGMFKEEDCHVNLRSGTNILERQAPKENEKVKGKGKGREVDEEAGPSQRAKETVGEYNILAHLRRTPALISVFETLMMSEELRGVMMEALQHPEKFQVYLAEKHMTEALYVDPASQITFTDEDMMMDTAKHNKPLYITGETNENQLCRMLVDPGSSINILPLRSVNQLALGGRRLSDENVYIHGFNQNSERALGSITLPMKFGELETLVKFYVIDADTSYKALLGRPWLHENRLVPSTLHQCVKYIQEGEQKTIKGDVHHYGVHEVELEEIDRYFTPASQRSTSPQIRWRVERESEDDNERIRLKGRSKTSCVIKTPIYVRSSDEEDEGENQRRNPCVVIDFEEESDQRNAIYVYDTDSDEEFDGREDSMAIEQVPMGYFKELTPREVNQIKDLEIFYVPPKLEKVQERMVHHKGILFYKAEGVEPSDGTSCSNDWEKWLEEEEDEYERVEIMGYYNKELMPLFQKSRCLGPISRRRAKAFQNLWSGKSRWVKGLDGKLINTKGLGFKIPPGEVLMTEVVECHMLDVKSVERKPEEGESIQVAKNAPQYLKEYYI